MSSRYRSTITCQGNHFARGAVCIRSARSTTCYAAITSRPHHSPTSSKTSGSTTITGRRISRSGCVYDRVRPGLCERFSGAIVSGTYDGFFVIDTHVDLETLWGRSARELRDRLRTATAPIDKFRVLEAALLARLSGSVIRHGAVRFALHAFGGSNPTTVRDVSERVGLTKLLHRVQRFQRVL